MQQTIGFSDFLPEFGGRRGRDQQPKSHLCPSSIENLKICYICTEHVSEKLQNIFHYWMIFFVGSSQFQFKHAELKGAMPMILLSVVCVASGFTPEMPELPDLRCRRLEIPSFSRLSQSASSFVARSSWHRGKSLWWKFHIENGGGTKGVPSQGLAD